MSDLTSTIYAGVFSGVPSVQNSSYRNPIQDWLADAITEKTNGVKVTSATALGYAPVWACLNKIAGHVGYLPLTLYKRSTTDPRARDEDATHPAFKVLDTPNDYMTGQTFRETLTYHALFGNGRAMIVRDGRGNASELIPLPPNQTSTVLVKPLEKEPKPGNTGDAARDGTNAWEKYHVVKFDTGAPLIIHDKDVLHIPGLSYDGITGFDVIELAKQSLGLGMSAEKASVQHFNNGARPSFMLKAPPGVLKKKEDAEEFIKHFNQRHSGTANDGRVGLLRDGIDIAMTQQTPRDSEWIEQRKFQRQEVALWFAVERILGDNTTVSYNSLEETNRAYVVNCLTRWLCKWEMECYSKLLTNQQKATRSHFFKFITAALLRGTTKDRFEVYSQGRQMEVLSANDVRVLEDMNPIEGGDEYKNPAINPTVTADASTDDAKQTDPAPKTDKAANALRSVVEARMTDLIKVEVQRIRQAAEKPKKFLDWMETFYSTDEFGGRIAKVWKECNALGMDATEYIGKSKAIILDVSGKVDSDGFAEAISQATDNWAARAAIEAERICKELV